jgi:hypothetical protein
MPSCRRHTAGRQTATEEAPAEDRRAEHAVHDAAPGNAGAGTMQIEQRGDAVHDGGRTGASAPRCRQSAAPAAAADESAATQRSLSGLRLRRLVGPQHGGPQRIRGRARQGTGGFTAVWRGSFRCGARVEAFAYRGRTRAENWSNRSCTGALDRLPALERPHLRNGRVGRRSMRRPTCSRTAIIWKPRAERAPTVVSRCGSAERVAERSTAQSTTPMHPPAQHGRRAAPFQKPGRSRYQPGADGRVVGYLDTVEGASAVPVSANAGQPERRVD